MENVKEGCKSRALGLHLRIPVHEVDQIQWLPGWRRAPLDEVARTLEAWAADDSWIIDGFGPWPVIDRRLGRADTIVYVDFPLRTHLWWAAKRQVVSFVRRRAWGGQSAPPLPASACWHARMPALVPSDRNVLAIGLLTVKRRSDPKNHTLSFAIGPPCVKSVSL